MQLGDTASQTFLMPSAVPTAAYVLAFHHLVKHIDGLT